MKIKSLSVDLDAKAFTFESMRQLVDEFLKASPHEAKKFWDCLTALRGPDQGINAGPAYIDGHDPAALSAAQKRKNDTTAILRARLFPGAAGCSAAQMNCDPEAIVKLPPKEAWDHFDKHVFKAVIVMNIPYQIGEGAIEGGPITMTAKAAPGYEVVPDPKSVGVFVPGVNIAKHPSFQPGAVFKFYHYNAEAGDVLMVSMKDGGKWQMEAESPFHPKELGKCLYWIVLEHTSESSMVLVEGRPAVPAVPKNKWSIEKQQGPGKVTAEKVSPAEFHELVMLAKHVATQAASKGGATITEGPWYDEINNVILMFNQHKYTLVTPGPKTVPAADGGPIPIYKLDGPDSPPGLSGSDLDDLFDPPSPDGDGGGGHN